MDRLLGGLQASDLIILAGRPSMGKTALATNMAFNAAQAYQQSGGNEGAVVGFFSLEMSAEQLATRILSDQAEIPSEKIRKGEMKRADFPRLVQASERLRDPDAVFSARLRALAGRFRMQEIRTTIEPYLDRDRE